MRKQRLILMVIGLLITIVAAQAEISLQEVFIQAGSQDGYDKYIELDPDSLYTGDLFIPNGLNVYIDGRGALIYGLPYYTSIHVFGSHLDISHCAIFGGYNAIFLDTMSTGNVNSNTIVGCQNIGIFVLYQDPSEDVEVWDNIITDCDYGIVVEENWHPRYVGYNTIYAIETYRYGELCPS